MKNKIIVITFMLFFSRLSNGQSTVTSSMKTVTGWAINDQKIQIDGNFTESIWLNSGKCAYNSVSDEFSRSTLLDQKININDAGTLGTPPDYPDLALYTSTVTYGIVWDDTHLYLAIAVKDPSVKAVALPVTNKNAAAMFVYFRAGDSVSTAPLSHVFPTVYNRNDLEMVFSYISNADTNLTKENAVQDPIEGIDFFNSDFKAKMKPTSNGYHMEIAIKWSMINKNFIDDITGMYLEDSKRPKDGRVLGFDLTNNIPKSDGTTRQAKMQWNMCCANRNWIESVNFGTLVLAGTANVILTTTSTLINGPGTVTIAGFNTTESLPFTNLKWKILSDIPNAARINDAGILTPQKNGIITVTGTFNSNISPQLVLTITNIPAISGMSVEAGNINTQWGSSVLQPSFLPAGSYSDLRYSVSNNFAIINTITGLLSATGLGNGIITVTATSVSSPSIFATKEVEISNQAVPTLIYTYIDSDSASYCGLGLSSATLPGVSGNTFRLKTRYCISPTEVLDIPDEFMTYSSKFIITPTATISGSTIKYTQTRPRVPFTITGFNKYSPDIQSNILVTQVNSLLGTSVCNKDVSAATLCQNFTGIFNDSDFVLFSIFPNPNDGNFTINSDKEGVIFSIVNRYGLVMSHGYLQKGRNDFKIKLPPGIYFVRSADFTSKLVVH